MLSKICFVALVVIFCSVVVEGCMQDATTESKSDKALSETRRGGSNRRTTTTRRPNRYERCGSVRRVRNLPTVDGTSIQSNHSNLAPSTVWIHTTGTTDAICVGTTIHPQWAIVRRSCIEDIEAFNLTVKLPADGEDDDRDKSGSNENSGESQESVSPGALVDPPTTYSSSVISVVLHEGYNSATGMYDVALIKVSTPFPRSSEPICMPGNELCTTATSVITGSGFVGGWLSDGIAPLGGYWSLLRVAVTPTGNECEATVAPNGLVGDHPSIIASPVSSSSRSKSGKNSREDEDVTRMALALLPNDDDGLLYTSICCVMDFINTNVV